LRSNSSQAREDDGGPSNKAPNEATGVQEVQEANKVIKEVQVMVRKVLTQPDSFCASSSSFWPALVWLVECDPGRIISCTHIPLKA